MINVESFINHTEEKFNLVGDHRYAYRFGYLCSMVKEIITRFPETEIVIKEHAEYHNYKEEQC